MAHRHAIAINNNGLNCSVFTGDLTLTRPVYSSWNEHYEGIKVNRVALSETSTCSKSANFRDPNLLPLFLAVLKEDRPDVVHFHNLPGLSVDFIDIAKSQGCLTVLTAHDPWGFCHRQTLIKNDGSLCHDYSGCHECLSHYIDIDGCRQPIQNRNEYVRNALKKLDLLISPSYYLAQQYVLADFAPKNVAVLKYGVDLNFFSSKSPSALKSDKLRFGVACHLGEHKGIRTILEALKLIKETSPLEIIIAGKGPMEDDVKSYAQQESNGNLLKFVGAVPHDQMAKFYQGIDVFIVASIWPENQPLTILEAMACGAAVIATDCGGCPELVVSGETGAIFPRGNPQALAELIMSYANSPATAITHGQKGRRQVSRHSISRTATRLRKIYRDLIAGNILEVKN